MSISSFQFSCTCFLLGRASRVHADAAEQHRDQRPRHVTPGRQQPVNVQVRLMLLSIPVAVVTWQVGLRSFGWKASSCCSPAVVRFAQNLLISYPSAYLRCVRLRWTLHFSTQHKTFVRSETGGTWPSRNCRGSKGVVRRLLFEKLLPSMVSWDFGGRKMTLLYTTFAVLKPFLGCF